MLTARTRCAGRLVSELAPLNCIKSLVEVCPESQESITTFEMNLDTKNLDSSKFCFNANWPLTEGVVVD